MTDPVVRQPCTQCGADLPPNAESCALCGAPNEAVLQASPASIRLLSARLRLWRQGAAIGIVVAFGLGLSVGNRMSRADREAVALAEAARAPLTVEQSNDLFMRAMNKKFEEEQAPIDFVSWVPTPGGIQLEMAPPTAQHPVTLWQALLPEQRTAMLAFISIAYTRSLAANGIPVNLAKAHPVVVLTYRGSSSPLAVRQADGKLAVYPSPYDASTPSAATPRDSSPASR